MFICLFRVTGLRRLSNCILNSHVYCNTVQYIYDYIRYRM